MPSLLKCALQTLLPTSGAGQITAYPQININRHPAGLLDSHSKSSIATFLDKKLKIIIIIIMYSSHKAYEALDTTFPFTLDPVKPIREEDFTKYCFDSEPGKQPPLYKKY